MHHVFIIYSVRNSGGGRLLGSCGLTWTETWSPGPAWISPISSMYKLRQLVLYYCKTGTTYSLWEQVCLGHFCRLFKLFFFRWVVLASLCVMVLPCLTIFVLLSLISVSWRNILFRKEMEWISERGKVMGSWEELREGKLVNMYCMKQIYFQ